MVVEVSEVTNVEIEITVVINVSESCTHAPLGKSPLGVCYLGFLSYFSECAVAVIAVEFIWPEVGHVKVQISVIVDIAYGNPTAPFGVSQPRRHSDIGEGAIIVVSQEIVVRQLP